MFKKVEINSKKKLDEMEIADNAKIKANNDVLLNLVSVRNWLFVCCLFTAYLR